MRIGVVTTTYPRDTGEPAAQFVAGLAAWLAAAGHDVDVLAAGPGPREEGAVRVHRVLPGGDLFRDPPERPRRQWASAVRFQVALVGAVAARKWRGRWERVISHRLVPSGVAAALAAPTIPQIAVVHPSDVHLLSRRRMVDTSARVLLRREARFAFVAEQALEQFLAGIRSPRLREQVAARAIVVPMGIDAAALRGVRAGGSLAARGRLGLPGDAPIIAYVGRLVPVKGIDVLLAARPDGAVLAVAGTGPEGATLEGREGVFLLGDLRGDRKEDLLAAADVLVIPSRPPAEGRSEGAPAVVLEALAAGIPVVASDLPGLRALAADAATLVRPDDPGALREALIQALRAPDEVRVARGRQRAARHDWSVIAPQLLEADGAQPALRV